MDAAKLVVSITADIDNLSRNMDKAGADMREAFSMKNLVGSGLITDALERVGEAFIDIGRDAIQGLMDAEKANAQTAAAIKSTGGAARVSVNDVAALSDSLERMSGVEAENIQAGANMLLTFTNIKNGVGAGNDVFNQATKTALDMSVALGTDAKNSAMQLGKALNDPITGVSALQRVGVTFTDSQKEQIKTLVESGKTMEAQKIILNELGKEFGGSAKAAGETMAGSLKKLENGFGALTESIMQGAVPMITSFADEGAKAFYAVSDAINQAGLLGAFTQLFGPEMKAALLGIGTAVTAAIIPALGEMAVAAYAAAVPMIAQAAAVIAAWTPFIALAGAIAFAATPIMKYWDDLSFEFGHVFDFVKTKASEFVNWVTTGFQHLANNVIGPVVRFISEKLSALWGAMPQQAKDALKGTGLEFKGLGADLGGSLQLAGVAVAGGAKFVAGNIRESFSGWTDMFNAGNSLVKKFTSSVPVDFDKLAKGAVRSMGEVGEAVKAGADKAGKHAKDIKNHAKDVGLSFSELKAKLKGLDVLGEASAQFKAFREGVSKDLEKDLQLVGVRVQVFGGAINEAAEETRAYEKAIEDLLKKGVKPTDKQIQELAAKWRISSDAAKEFKAEHYDVAKALKEVEADLAKVDVRAGVFGKTVDVSADKAILLTRALDKMIDEGIKPSDPAFKSLKAQLDALKPSQDASANAFLTFKTALTNASTSMAGVVGNVNAMLEPLGVALPAVLTDGATKAVGFVDSAFKMADAVKNVGPNVSGLVANMSGLWTAVSGLIPVLIGFAETAMATVIPAVISVGTAIAGALGPIGLIAVGITGLVAAGFWLAENWETVSAMVSGIWQGMADGASGIFGALGNAMRGIWEGIIGVVKGGVNGLIGALNFFIRGLNRISFTVPDWVPGFGGKHWGINVPQVPYLADGGVTTGPAMAMIGEGRYQEAVLPLSASTFAQIGAGVAANLPGSGGGDTYIEITIQGQNDPERMAEQLVRLLRKKGLALA